MSQELREYGVSSKREGPQYKHQKQVKSNEIWCLGVEAVFGDVEEQTEAKEVKADIVHESYKEDAWKGKEWNKEVSSVRHGFEEGFRKIQKT